MNRHMDPDQSSRRAGSRLRRRVVAMLIAFGVVAAPIAAVRADEDDAYYRNKQHTWAAAHFNDWMSWVDGSTNLSDLSIPASHDAMTYACPAGSSFPWCNTQSMDLEGQLESGIRFLDVRARQRGSGTPSDPSDDWMSLAHGQDDLVDANGKDLDLDIVFQEVCGFLAQHATETVVIRLSDTGVEDRHAEWGQLDPGKGATQTDLDLAKSKLHHHLVDVIATYFDRYRYDQGDATTCVWDPSTYPTSYDGQIPDLDMVRGKAVLMIGGDGAGGILFKEVGPNDDLDRFGPNQVSKAGGDPRDVSDIGFDNHVRDVTDHLIVTDAASSTYTFYLNQTNANGGDWNLGQPREYAGGVGLASALKGLNERFTEWFLGLSSVNGRDGTTISKTGVVYMDFPDAAFIGAVIAYNFDLAVDLSAAAPAMEQMIEPFAHHVAEDTAADAGARHRAMDKIWTHHLDDPSFQSFTFENDKKEAASQRQHTGVNVTSGWVHDYYYGFWLSEGRASGIDPAGYSRLFATVVGTSGYGSAEIHQDAVAAAVASEFPGYRVAVLVKEKPYDTGVHLDMTMLPDVLSVTHFNDEYLTVVWLYDGPTQPTARVVGATTADEGDTIVLDGSTSTTPVFGAPMSSCWTVDGDPTCRSTDPTFTISRDDDWAGEVTLTVDNGYGEHSTTVDVTFENVAPALAPLIARTAVEGSTLTIEGVIDDPGADAFVASVSWGDGATDVIDPLVVGSDGTFQLTHVYTDDTGGRSPNTTSTSGPVEKEFELRLSIVDDDGGRSGEATATVTVQNASPTNLELTAPTAIEGREVQLDGSFVDPGDDTFDITVDWGDGEPPLVLSIDGATSFTVSHVYADDDPSGTPVDAYPVTVTVTDDDRGTIVGSTTVTVRNAAPAVTLAGSRGHEGEVLTFTGTVDDPGDDTFEAAAVDWGDGTPIVERPIHVVDGTFTISHRYVDDPSGEETAAYRVTVRITDDDAGVGTTSAAAFVTNVAPEITALTSTSGDEGAEVLIEGRLVDPGDDTFTAIVDWGDGTEPLRIQLSPAPGGGFELAHTYADDGVYTVTVGVLDDDGGRSNPVTTTVMVRNVAPTIVGIASPTGSEGDTITVAGRLVDPGTDEFVARVDWGDGSGPQPVELGPVPNGELVLEHVYADDGVYSVSVQIRDDDGGVSNTSTASITVHNVAPSIQDLSRPSTTEAAAVRVSGTVVDPGADTFVTTVVWGDGSTDTIDPLPVGSDGRFVLDHAYADDDPTGTPSDRYTVTVRVVDDDGGVDQASTVVRVDNVAPETRIEAVHDVRGNAIGSAERLDLALVGLDLTVDAGYFDVGTPDTHVTGIDWGDGTVEVDQTGVTTVWSHAYRVAGDHSVTVTVVDDDGGRSTVERVLQVRTAQDVLDDLAARLEVAIDTGPESMDLLQDALDAIAGDGKSALAIIDSGSSDIVRPLTDAAAALEIAGWTTDAEIVALVASSAVVAIIVDATAGALSERDQAAIDQALANLAAGDATPAPVGALGHYADASKELKKYV